MATIVGKILKGVTKVLPFAAGVAAFLIPGVGPAVGTGILGVAGKAAAKVAATVKGSIGGQIVGGVGSLLGKTAKSAVNLVTGTTADERAQVKLITKAGKAAQDKLDQAQRLIHAGASQAQAYQMAGISASELGSADSQLKDLAAEEKIKTDAFTGKTYTAAGSGCAGMAFLIVSYGIFLFTFIVILLS